MADPNKPGYHLVGSLSLAQHKMDIFDSVLEKEFGSVGVDMDSFNTDVDSPSASASMVQKAKAPPLFLSLSYCVHSFDYPIWHGQWSEASLFKYSSCHQAVKFHAALDIPRRS